jgi:hypothetical protein
MKIKSWLSESKKIKPGCFLCISIIIFGFYVLYPPFLTQYEWLIWTVLILALITFVVEIGLAIIRKML